MWDSHLLDTAIGGLIALLGTGVAQWFGFFSSRLERQQKHGELQRERLLKISDGIADGMAWRENFQRLQSLSTVSSSSPIPCVRPATMLCRIYFPDLIFHALAYQRALGEYHVFGMMSYGSNYKDDCPVGVKMNLHDRDKWLQFSTRLSSLRDSFDEAIEKEAKKHEPSA